MKQTTLILTLMLCMAGSLQATTRLRDLVFMPISQPNLHHSHGYVEHRIRITNESHQNRYNVKLVAPAQSYSWGDSIEHIERTVLIDPGVTVNVTLPQPALNLAGSSQVRVYVNGSDWGTAGLSSIHSGHSGTSAQSSILCSRSINGQAFCDAIGKKFAKNNKHTPKYNITRSELELPEWSDNWLAYSCYDAILLHASDIAALPTTIREALYQYITAGGVLAVAGTLQMPFGWKGIPNGNHTDYSKYHTGFGQLLLFKTNEFKNLEVNQMRSLLDAAKATKKPWSSTLTIEKAIKIFPVVNDMSLPTRGMFLIMLIFAIIIGPVMLIVLARKNKRIWLLWMAPSFSFIVCVLISIYSMFSEGITPSVRIESMTLLNQKTHRAVTIGMLGLYCPLTPSGGLHLSKQTELSSYITRGYNKGSQKSINWTRDQHLSRGWVSARIPAFFRIRIPETRRERLGITKTENGLQVINGLGADIKELWLHDYDGRWFTLEKELASGAKATLSSTPKPSSHSSDMRSIYKANKWTESFNRILDCRSTLVQPNMYIAVLDGAPFMNHGLSGKVNEHSLSYVIGTFQGAAGKNNIPNSSKSQTPEPGI